jgi:opacity protein-like surface antigen
MRNLLLAVMFMATAVSVQAQNSEKELILNTEKAVKSIADTTKNGWKKKGTVSFLFNQSNFNNWIAGGENNLSGNLGINYDFNYKKDDMSWDNKVLASYGLLQTGTADFEKKTDDRLELNSLLGKRVAEESNWYYSLFLNFRTQFTKGYVYGKDVNGAEIRTEFTDFLSPGYLTFGPGIY